MKQYIRNILPCLLCFVLLGCDNWTIDNRSIFDNTAVERLSYFVEWNSPTLIDYYVARHPDVDIDTESTISCIIFVLRFALTTEVTRNTGERFGNTTGRGTP